MAGVVVVLVPATRAGTTVKQAIALVYPWTSVSFPLAEIKRSRHRHLGPIFLICLVKPHLSATHYYPCSRVSDPLCNFVPPTHHFQRARVGLHIPPPLTVHIVSCIHILSIFYEEDLWSHFNNSNGISWLIVGVVEHGGKRITANKQEAFPILTTTRMTQRSDDENSVFFPILYIL